ncbi:heterokaryon incompatibility protein-domain-containing protein [Phyllosticta citribraziliensis]
MDEDLAKCPRQRPYPDSRKGELDWTWARSWLDLKRPTSTLEPIPAGFRLIDVQSKSVVRAPPFSTHLKYACLSYVWGQTTSYQATRESIHLLEREGSLAHKDVPATIRDAMTACRRLGIGYLWVDRLCIIQDDDDPDGEKQAQIDNMGRIYSHAFVGLAATEGEDANSGLRGVSKSLIRTQHFWRSFDMKDSAIGVSKWAKRGWTYQEAILSRQLMMFTASDVFFEREKDPLHRVPSSFHWFHGPAITYRQAVSNYTQRALSNLNDVLNAFHGVCDYLFDEDHRFGIPLNSFHNAVSWLPVHDEHERRPSQGQHIFPTWSWISVKGQISIDSSEDLGKWGTDTLPVSSWVFVDRINTSGKASMSFPRPPDPGQWHTVVSVAGWACRSGCMPTVPPTLLPYEPGSGTEARYIESKWRSPKEFWEGCQAFDESGSPAYLAEIPEEQKRLAASPGRVLVFSQAAVLPIEAWEDSETVFHPCLNDARKSPTLQTRFGRTLDDSPTLQALEHGEPLEGGNRCGVYIGGEKAGMVSFDDQSHGREKLKSTKEVQFVSIWASRRWKRGLFSQFGKQNPDVEILQCLVLELDKWNREEHDVDYFCVMAIETLDSGVSRPIGLGFVDFSMWLEMRPKKASFVLE